MGVRDLESYSVWYKSGSHIFGAYAFLQNRVCFVSFQKSASMKFQLYKFRLLWHCDIDCYKWIIDLNLFQNLCFLMTSFDVFRLHTNWFLIGTDNIVALPDKIIILMIPHYICIIFQYHHHISILIRITIIFQYYHYIPVSSSGSTCTHWLY